MKLKKILPLLECTYETYLTIEDDEMETVYTLINGYETYKNYNVVRMQPYSSRGRTGILFILSRE